jgi:hypothetical protein
MCDVPSPTLQLPAHPNETCGTHLELPTSQSWLDEVGDIKAATTAATAANRPSAHQRVHLINPV